MATSTNGKYSITDNVQKRFFKNPQFCSSLQDSIRKIYSVEININLITEPKRYRNQIDTHTYQICVIEADMQQTVFDFITNYLKKIQTRKYSNRTDFPWLSWFLMEETVWKFLSELLNRKMPNLFTIVSVNESSLNVFYLSRDPLDENTNGNEIESLLKNEIFQEILFLPPTHERSSQLETELKELQNENADGDDEVAIIPTTKSKSKQIVLFGCEPRIIELKKKFVDIIEKNLLHTYKLSSIDGHFSEHSRDACFEEIEEIEEKYKQYGVKIRLPFNEFLAPAHLKDEIQHSIEQLFFRFSSTITRTFQSMPLCPMIAENEEKRLKSMTRNRCVMQIQYQPLTQSYGVPKASSSTTETFKFIVTQSELFTSSPDVFKKMTVGMGFIELRMGDIALQEVDTVIISTSYNGLKEGLIDRASPFDFEKTYLEPDGTMYTETDGGKLKCRRILFSNWSPISMIRNDEILSKSIQSFIAKSLNYTKGAASIAFAVPDTSPNELILATEIIAETKRHLENNQFEQRISFVFLPEQQALYEQFAQLIDTSTNIYAYFDWPTTVMKITLATCDDQTMTRCLDKITRSLSRSATSFKLTHSSGIFQNWNQHFINFFYKFCKDQYVLSKFDAIENILELIGPSIGIEKVTKHWHMLTKLVQSTPTIERPNSTLNSQGATLYNIVVSSSSKDSRRCQRLINRLIEEGFSVGIDLNEIEEKHDIYSRMDKCDCIILCISENYYENLRCLEEAKYAFRTDRKVFLVQIRKNHSFHWKCELFDSELFFYILGSDDFFNYEYGRLLVELMQFTKPGFTSLLRRRASWTQSQDIDGIRPVSRIARSREEQIRQTAIERSQNFGKPALILRQLTEAEEIWLEQLTDVYQLTFERSQSHSSHNEVVLPKILTPKSKTSDTSIQSVVTSPHRVHKSEYCSMYTLPSHPLSEQPILRLSIDPERTYGEPTGTHPSTGSSRLFPKEDFHDDFIPRKMGRNEFYGKLGNETRSEEEMEERRKLDNPEVMKDRREQFTQYFMNKYKHYTQEQMNEYSTFAQRMRDNTLTFEKFCLTMTASN